MGKIVLKYPDLYKLNPKIDVFLNDKKIVEIERGQEKEITISENGILMFKGSIRKTKLNVKENCDYSISLGWDSFTGKLIAIIDSSTDEQININTEELSKKSQKQSYYMIAFYSVLFLVTIIGITNTLGLFSSGNKEETQILGTWDNDMDRSLVLSKNGKCDFGINRTGTLENLSCSWRLEKNILYIQSLDEACGTILGKTSCKKYNETIEFIVDDSMKSMTRSDGRRIYYKR